MICANVFKKIMLSMGIILLLPVVLSTSVFAERSRIEGYGAYFLGYDEIADEALVRERARIIRELDELNYQYAHAGSETERQYIRCRIKRLEDKLMKNQPYITTYDTAMAKLAYNDGVDCGNNKEYGNAIEYYRKALCYDPHFYSAYNNMGIIYENILLDYEKARECFERAVQINPAYDYAYCNLGILYMEAYKDYEKAMEYYNKVLRLNPKFPGIHRYIARLYLAVGKYTEAMEEVQQEMSVGKPKAYTYCTLGQIYLETGEYNKAMEAFEKAISMDKDCDDAYLFRGLTHEKMGDKVKAMQDIGKAKELNPYSEEIRQHYERLK